MMRSRISDRYCTEALSCTVHDATCHVRVQCASCWVPGAVHGTLPIALRTTARRTVDQARCTVHDRASALQPDPIEDRLN
jgi:hypothetical protein